MAGLFWPLGPDRIVTSPFGQRGDEFHSGVDFGFPGGSASAPVYAVDSGTVRYCGAADGYGGPDPCGWIVVESPSGCWEYGHIRRQPTIRVGATVTAGQQIAVINPDTNTNGGTADNPIAPHLHLSYMAGGYNPDRKTDPIPRLAGAADPPGGAMPLRPDFNEYAMWSPNNSDRGGTKVDAFFIHTQEGPGNADSLARFLDNPANQVSYHYTISQAPDGGVTVCDVVDTDLASWSVLSANNRSINLCFAGSSASWSRAQWLAQAKAIDVAAYLIVQDCRKYGIPIKVIAPPYTGRIPGISDHRYVTKVLGDGTHTDVGDQFPWDLLAAAVDKYAGTAKPPAPAPAPAPKPTPAADLARLWTEWNAIIFSDQPSILALAQQARAGDSRSDDALQRVNPVALQQFIDSQKKGA